MQNIRINELVFSRFILGSNPFGGFSHQNTERDWEMRRFFTFERIKQTLRDAESLGINAFMGGTNHHIPRMLLEYRDEGGKIQWFAQTTPSGGSTEMCIQQAIDFGAVACHIHGGVVDNMLAQGRIGEIPPLVEKIRKAGIPAGIAGHNPKVFEWAEEAKLPVDYYMCCYYNAAHRDERAEHVSGMAEWFNDEDRKAMTDLIRQLSKPVIHYKILAAGRKTPEEGFTFAAKAMRPNDAVCVGIFQRDNPNMLAEDVGIFEKALAENR